MIHVAPGNVRMSRPIFKQGRYQMSMQKAIVVWARSRTTKTIDDPDLKELNDLLAAGYKVVATTRSEAAYVLIILEK